MQRRFSRFSQAFFSSLQKRGNHHHKRKAILQQPYWLIAIPAGACAVWYVAREPAPYTGRQRVILLSKSQEMAMGESAFKEIMSREKILPVSHPKSKLVSQVGRELARASKTDLPWEFIVVDDPSVNAFVLPGGKVVVYSGLFQVLKNHDSLAAVLGHEVGHALARHAAEKITVSGFLTSLLFLFVPSDFFRIAEMITKVGVELPFSRKFELEADSIGLQLMAEACYDPRESPRVFARLRDLGNEKPMKYLSTHPPDDERIKKLQGEMNVAMNIFQNGDCINVRNSYARRI